ncbi:hypothetical protein DAPPUDRAFT_120194 [Daphnia pulex]|uniref:Uncharacterized protein n=1 Tax=Daphnia pulex TaxID=6669 RepID=E9I0L2_DAPPU|nr:hypothetical protein DAPPUDRAFT_120194 [Daphnia pulex]|eukprot:EFX62469.1 hypothetical protein DAPPUDRAFT_120194 [Daphnia pulex]
MELYRRVMDDAPLQRRRLVCLLRRLVPCKEEMLGYMNAVRGGRQEAAGSSEEEEPIEENVQTEQVKEEELDPETNEATAKRGWDESLVDTEPPSKRNRFVDSDITDTDSDDDSSESSSSSDSSDGESGESDTDIHVAMFNTKDVQHGVKKFTPVSLFTLAMILLGALVNTFPPDEESIVIGRDFNCDDIPRRNLSARVTPFNNFSDHTVVPSLGLAAVSLLLPLMPLVVPVFALDVKKHTGWSHSIVENPDNPLGVTASARAELNKIAARFVLQLVVGQASCYGSTELARHFILKPDKTFFEKCKFSRTTCKTLERVGMLVYRVGGNDTTSNVTSLCQNSDLPHLALHESLHSLPNTTCSVIGSSLPDVYGGGCLPKLRPERTGGRRETAKDTLFHLSGPREKMPSLQKQRESQALAPSGAHF